MLLVFLWSKIMSCKSAESGTSEDPDVMGLRYLSDICRLIRSDQIITAGIIVAKIDYNW